jgi:hypothetical protein
MNKFVEFFRFFDKNRIYFPEALCSSLESIAMRVRSHVIEFGVYTQFDDLSLNDHTREQKMAAWTKGWEAIKNDIPTARKQLENEFRSLLGGDA